MRIKFLILWLILVIFPVFAHGKVADLKPCDVHSKINEFLYNHIYHKRLSKDIMRRAIGNCIDHLDPMKSYFTREELSAWLDPTDELLELTLNAFYKSDFSTFEEIYRKMLSSIERRSLFEDEIDKMKPLSKITIKDINDKEWCSTPQDLKEKLYKIRSIQSKYAKKLDPDFQNKFFVVLKKRRAWREQEIAGVKKEEQDPIIYTYILKSIAAALDSQTDYFPPDEAKMMMQQVQQRMLGVGVRLIDDITGFKVVDLVEGGPAIKQGELQVDDKIVAVDNEPVVGMDIQQAVHLIQGKENTPVKLTILRELKDENEKAETLDITITRGNIVVEESRLESFLEPFADGVIAHIILHGFYQDPNSSSAEDLFNKISDIKENNNLNGIILDLRNNIVIFTF